MSIFGKVGLHGLDSTTATAVRAVIMAIFLIGVVFAVVLAVIIFGEKVSALQLLAIVLIAAGGLLLAIS